MKGPQNTVIQYLTRNFDRWAFSIRRNDVPRSQWQLVVFFQASHLWMCVFTQKKHALFDNLQTMNSGTTTDQKPKPFGIPGYWPSPRIDCHSSSLFSSVAAFWPQRTHRIFDVARSHQVAPAGSSLELITVLKNPGDPKSTFSSFPGLTYVGCMFAVFSGKRLQFAIENGHRNSGFTHEKWWFSIVFCMLTRGSPSSPSCCPKVPLPPLPVMDRWCPGVPWIPAKRSPGMMGYIM